MDFGKAIDLLKNGSTVARAGWNGKNMWVRLQRPDEHSLMTEAYIYMRHAGGGNIPWLASQADVLAEDWVRL